MSTLILSATTLLRLRRAAVKTVLAHLPEGEGMTESGLSAAMPQEPTPPYCALVFGARQEADSKLARERLWA